MTRDSCSNKRQPLRESSEKQQTNNNSNLVIGTVHVNSLIFMYRAMKTPLSTLQNPLFVIQYVREFESCFEC